MISIARLATLCALLSGLAAVAGPALAGGALFDVQQRREELQAKAFESARAACLAPKAPTVEDLDPIDGFESTEGYGADRAARDFNWAVMILSGRALAGDGEAGQRLGDLLVRWAEAGAFEETEEQHDAYFALKRSFLPVVVAYSIVRDSLDAKAAARTGAWIDGLVRRVDRRFDGEVDHNNHRILADGLLSAWGALIEDDALLDRGDARLRMVLASADRSGALPLELRRGSRALWYQRLALDGLVVIAEALRTAGRPDPYAVRASGVSLETLSAGLLNGVTAPTTVMRQTSINYIPGPSERYWEQDLGFLDRRGHDRHYLAFGEILRGQLPQGLTRRRFEGFMARHADDERPLIDEFVGGNATCFWWQPPAVEDDGS